MGTEAELQLQCPQLEQRRTLKDVRKVARDKAGSKNDAISYQIKSKCRALAQQQTCTPAVFEPLNVTCLSWYCMVGGVLGAGTFAYAMAGTFRAKGRGVYAKMALKT